MNSSYKDRSTSLWCRSFVFRLFSPELSKDYPLMFVDRACKSNFLNYVNPKHRYSINISCPRIKSMEVSKVEGLNLDNVQERQKVVEKIRKVSIVLAAVGLSHYG